MENASKALIIAGAILISILIIALGVFIYQKASGASQDLGGLDETKIQSTNQKFENYEGIQSGSDVKALIDLVRTNNNTYETSENRTITLKGDAATNWTDLSTAKGEILNGSTYTVKMSKYYSSGASKGLIEEITIDEK